MFDEGVIKFICLRKHEQLLSDEDVAELEYYRSLLFARKWIGIGRSGIGFGNISFRHPAGFIITGSQTGGLPVLSKDNYVLVTDTDTADNTVHCSGLTDASSESMTHAVLYASDPGINAVMHIHDDVMWRDLSDSIPYIPADIPYGTSEMAKAVQKLFKEHHPKAANIFGMAGHYGGLVSFAGSLEQAYAALDRYK